MTTEPLQVGAFQFAAGSMAHLATITVTYQPDISALRRQWLMLPADCHKFIVDNGSGDAVRESLLRLVRETPKAHAIFNDTNLGLAEAINRGARAVIDGEWSITHLLFLDQDSEPSSGACDRLLGAFEQLHAEGVNVGCVGPLLLDVDTGLSHGFHQCTRWRWRRVYPTQSGAPLRCASLNGSGTLVDIATFRRLGGLDESLFIDHVDTDWSFRVVANGMTLWGIPAAVFMHRMGQQGRRLWCFGWRIWPSRSPGRHFYLFRNAVRLMRRPYVPRVWKVWALAKLIGTAMIHGFGDSERKAQLGGMLQGVRAGLRNE